MICDVSFGANRSATVIGRLTSTSGFAPNLSWRRWSWRGRLSNSVQLYRGGDRERDRLTRQWRIARINRFTEKQRRTREWINFAEIAEWCSKEDQSILSNKEKSAAAFDTLASDLLAGEFEENGRSRVLYLHPATARARMTREWLQDAIDHNYEGQRGRAQYLSHCWMPRRLFDRWLVKHRLQ